MAPLTPTLPGIGESPLAWPSPQHLSLEALKAETLNCTACRLSETRTHVVFADGNANAKILFIGEGPGQNEDETGIPFVGRAGQLLTKIIESVGLNRQQDTYIANIVKCRPPQNREPMADEMAACNGYLHEQIRWVKPHIIVLVGKTALKGIVGYDGPIGKIRGQWLTDTPYPQAHVMGIFHPSYLLRNASPAEGTPKWLTWQDMKAIRAKYEEAYGPLATPLPV
jgi:uracil-DNA glycosylase